MDGTMRRPVQVLLILTPWLLVCILTLPLGFAQKRGPSTPEERSKALKLIRNLEADPLGKGAKEARQWLLSWLGEVPDISVEVRNLLGRVMGSKKNYAPEIFFQATFSSAAFISEHSDQAQDDRAVYTAGVEGALKAYEAILKTKPKARWPFLDDLLEKQKKNELGEYVRQ